MTVKFKSTICQPTIYPPSWWLHILFMSSCTWPTCLTKMTTRFDRILDTFRHKWHHLVCTRWPLLEIKEIKLMPHLLFILYPTIFHRRQGHCTWLHAIWRFHIGLEEISAKLFCRQSLCFQSFFIRIWIDKLLRLTNEFEDVVASSSNSPQCVNSQAEIDNIMLHSAPRNLK